MASNDGYNDLSKSEEELKSRLKQLLANPDNVKAACNEIFDNLVETILIGEVFDVHMNRFHEVPTMSKEDKKLYSFEETKKCDIFADQLKKKKIPMCCCDVCKRSVAAVKYSAHLANCLGLGRRTRGENNRGIVNSKEKNLGASSDDDWVTDQEKAKLKKKSGGKKKKDKNKIQKDKSTNDKSIATKGPEESNQVVKLENQ